MRIIPAAWGAPCAPVGAGSSGGWLRRSFKVVGSVRRHFRHALTVGAVGALALAGPVAPARAIIAATGSGPSAAATTPIHDVQGEAHRSPMTGQAVSGVTGIVTAVTGNGFYLQDPKPDRRQGTSEALFVFTSLAPTAAVGDAVSVDGRVPPRTVIEDDATGDVETSGTFDPRSDGIDFYESLEGMRVQLDDAVAVGPSSSFGEIPVVGDDGRRASLRSARGGVLARPDDFNPERVFLDDQLAPTPSVNVGDRFPGAVVGVLDYSFGNFKLEVTSTPATASGGIEREVTAPAAAHQLAVATFNVENLDPNDPQSKFDQLAGLIVHNLQAPDLVAVEEIQDDNGATNDAVVDADVTFGTLIGAIQAAGGPTYEFRQINPVDDQDGGEPGGNIRVGFLFRGD